MKIVFVIVALFTGGDGEDWYAFQSPTFSSKTECVEFVQQNYSTLNHHVNKEYEAPVPFPNTMHCINQDLWRKYTLPAI